MKQKAPNNIFKIDGPFNFRIQVPNGQLKKPLAATTLKFDIGDITFAEHFVVMKNRTGPIIGLHLMRNNSVIINTTHGFIHFPHLTIQFKITSKMSAKPQVVLTDGTVTIPPRTTKTLNGFVDHPSEWNTTGAVTPMEKFTETASLMISRSMLTIIDKEKAVRLANTTESPYLFKEYSQIAEFSVVFPEQPKHIKPVDMAILSMIPQGDPDLTAYSERINPSS